MIGKTNAGGGGFSDIDFDLNVVGGTTEPSNPDENLMWINTSTPINSWIISAHAPESPSEGDVWIPYSLSAPVDIAITQPHGLASVGIHSAMQYESGGWVSKVSKYYENSTWKNFAKIFCLNGEFWVQPEVFSSSGTFTPTGNLLTGTGAGSNATRSGGWFWDVSGQMSGYTNLYIRCSILQAGASNFAGGFSSHAVSGFLSGYSSGYVSSQTSINIDQNFNLTDGNSNTVSDSLTYIGVAGNTGNNSSAQWRLTMMDCYLW